MAEYYVNIPSFDDLNTTQQTAVLDDNAISLSGGPGTGKSIVSLWRHILNHQRENPIISQLLTFTTTLALYLKKCSNSKNKRAASYVDSSKNWMFNHNDVRAEIIHDEAQDLPISFNNSLKNYSNKISYGADNEQILISNSRNFDGTYNLERCSPEGNLSIEFPQNSNHRLARNYRNSRKIMKLAHNLFANAPIPQEIIDSCTIDGEYPRLLISGNDNEKINLAVLQLIRDYSTNDTINIGILVPFENPNHIAGVTSTVDYYYNLLTNNNITCSRYTNIMVAATELFNIHITTFKSAKGLEFDVVILPDFHHYNTIFNVIDWHDFYVGVTRTKSNLFLISRVDIPSLPDNGLNKLIDKVIL